MKVSYESIIADRNCSFRTLHNNVPVKELRWEYHYHPEIELVCVISGNGTRHVGYHKSNFRNGDLVLIGSNIPHSGFGINSLDPHEEIVIQFREEIITFPAEIEEIACFRKLITLSQFGILFSPKTKKKILPKLFQLLETENSRRYPLLLHILFELSDEKDYVLLNKEVMPHTIISKHKERLQAIFTFVEKNYDKQIDINEVADLANLTLPGFCHFFKKATKITFSDFVNQYRIDKACTLLLEGKSISEVCYSTGYSSISYFGRTFKKYMNKTPTEFNNELIK
ncbi:MULTISPECIES: AraC family transcriptional regulator [Chryseobacterium]|uniref:AraC family transcriptional regulator n=1 Tax=Chryseobacterium TaxID=59732 RepID=UPI00195D02FF|nr:MULTISPECIES: AraC family transcriptional regulator [Chryseobacterium]MBM7420235.1 AraC-like DNA-binding protein [Chryseobacterium sp. JUb44]MDH6210177.1 AraC-like DNA-binding protein [Chryseobacterium sp. BIGb0186]WSO08898.1 AraC family transcriptional regulator [Chryseobacterium scophthalmum]